MTAPVEAPVQPLTYRIGAGAAAGVWLGLGAVRVALLGGGLLAAILALTAGLPVVVAVLPVLAAVCAGAARVGGRPALDWLAPLAGHHGGALAGRTRWHAGIPALPSAPAGRPVRLRLPAEFGRLSVCPCPDDPSVGMLTDAATRTATVVFDVCGVDRFALLGPAERDGLVAGWGDALAVLADTDDALVRLQLIERAQPAAALVPYPQEPDRGAGEDGLAEIAALATARETRLAAQWAFPRLDPPTLAALADRASLLCRALVSARLLARPLSADEVMVELATALTGRPAGPAVSGGYGPLSRRSEWTHVALDDRVHRAFVVSGWPSTPVGAAWLSPLLLAPVPEVTRTVSLHLQRLVPAAAARVARTRRAKAALDQADRARFGMSGSAALDNAQASGAAMDAELAAGYRAHRLAGLVSVSGETVGGLDEAARTLRQAAAACRLELRPLHGQHDVALAATVALCRLRPRGAG